MIEFAPVMTLEVVHAYYGGRCPDFEFFTPSGTGRILAGGRLLAKTRGSRLTVLHEKNTPQVAGRVLQFGLKLLNTYFPNFSEPAVDPADGMPLYRNAGTALQAPVGLFLNPAHPEDAELMREGLFGVVEVMLEAGFYDAPPAFQVAFAAREETLKYYVVARNYTVAEFNQLELTDEGFTTEARPRIEFDRVAASAFTPDDLPATTLGDGAARVTLFRSLAPVARRARARRRIQLARNSEVLVQNLPQPGAAASTANLIIHLSK